MKSKRTDGRDGRPMTADEMRRFEENVIHGGDEPAAGDVLDDRLSEDDRLTKSGRLRIADVERIEEKRR